VDGYIRVSRVGDRSGESYISPDVQREAIERWAHERDVELVLHEPEENVSGGSMDRPVFNCLMGQIRSGESGGIVVWKLDCFARTLVGGLTTLNAITERRALSASATEPLFDFTTADGRIFLQLNLMMAEYFRERTKGVVGREPDARGPPRRAHRARAPLRLGEGRGQAAGPGRAGAVCPRGL
jgi:site-specific DNA recombinase